MRATIRNTGSRTGIQIAQLYVGFPAAAGEPPRQLKGFQRVELATGESREVRFVMTADDLTVWDDRRHASVRPAGAFTAWVGGSSRDLGAPTRF